MNKPTENDIRHKQTQKGAPDTNRSIGKNNDLPKKLSDIKKHSGKDTNTNKPTKKNNDLLETTTTHHKEQQSTVKNNNPPER